ncbi:MAG: lytic transglycosylase domain-containing protein [Patescibacteria group bacterium]
MTLGNWKVRSWEIDFTKIGKVLKNVSLSVILFAMLPTSFAPISGVTEANTQKGTLLNVKFDRANPLSVDTKISTITPGESKIEKNVRLAAEAEAAARNTVSRGTRIHVDPSNFDEMYQRAGAAYGVSPALLKAVHIVETGASGSTSRANPSGATGPMQFLPSTFRAYGVDGNGDGVKDICNVEDAVFSAARYLKACGYPNVKLALYGYNPSSRYVNKVANLAYSFGM